MKRKLFTLRNRWLQRLFLIPIFLLGFNTFLEAQTTVTIGDASGTSTTSTNPIYGLYSYSYSQSLYLESEIDAAGWTGSGIISKIRYKLDSAPGSPTHSNDWTIYMGNTILTNMNDDSPSDYTPASEMELVFSGLLDLSSAGWVEIVLDSPFEYTGDNLIIAVYESAPGYSSADFIYNPTSNKMVRYLFSDAYEPDPTLLPGTYSGNSGSTYNRAVIQMDIISACPTAPILTAGAVNNPVCEGADIELLATSSIPGSTFSWSGPDGFNSTNQNPVISEVQLSQAGVYTLEVTEPDGCTATKKIVIGVTPGPVFTATASENLICSFPESIDLAVDISPAPNVYCNSYFDFAGWEYITNVNYEGINNTTSGTAGGPVDYTSHIANVTAGISATLGVTIQADFSDYLYVFIDWNQNGILDDVGEVYILASATSSSGTYSYTVMPPMTAINGPTRMRVMVAYSLSSPDPCTSATSWGEAEDYTVHVSGGVDRYTFSWTDGSSILSTDSAFTVSTTENTVYTASVTDATSGCMLNHSAPVALVSEPEAHPIADKTEICEGEEVKLTALNRSYCNSNFDITTWEYVTNVTFEEINNSSGGNSGGPVNYTSQIAYLTVGETSTLSVTIAADEYEDVYAFIDWNQNGVLDDPGEYYPLALGTSSNGPHTISITPPADAINGLTRMRVMVVYWPYYYDDPCMYEDYGEAEDYSIHVSGGVDANTYTWSDGSSVVSTDPEITVAPTETTTYTLSIADGRGCFAPSEEDIIITVHPTPSISVSTINDNTDCQTPDGSIIFGSTSFIDGEDYEVFMNGSSKGLLTASSGEIEITGLNAATYSDIYVVTANGCPSDTIPTATVGGLDASSEVLVSTSSSDSYNQGAGETYQYKNADCELIATIESTGGALGNVTAQVNIDASAGEVNNMPYLRRNYQFTADNPSVPATITLYLTSDDIDNYNANNDTFPDIDDATLSNLKVTAYHNDAGSGGSGPDGHDLSDAEFVSSVIAVYHAGEDYWAITFTTSGFSGFYFHTTDNNTPLNISLGKLSAAHQGNSNHLKWNSLEEGNASHFEIERSDDGRSFAQIGKVQAKGQPTAYTYEDRDYSQGNNFYKVALVDVNGKKVYSNIAKVVVSQDFIISAFPNPTSHDVTLTINGVVGKDAKVVLTDLSGKVICQSNAIYGNELIVPMESLAQGIYMIQYTDENHSATIKVSKTN